MYCKRCGKEIEENALFCVHCGARQGEGESTPNSSRYVDIQKDWLIVLLFAVFLGGLGVHRFFVGKIETGILMLLTCGGCGIWVIIDIILIVTDNFTDATGKVVARK